MSCGVTSLRAKGATVSMVLVWARKCNRLLMGILRWKYGVNLTYRMVPFLFGHSIRHSRSCSRSTWPDFDILRQWYTSKSIIKYYDFSDLLLGLVLWQKLPGSETRRTNYPTTKLPLSLLWRTGCRVRVRSPEHSYEGSKSPCSASRIGI